MIPASFAPPPRVAPTLKAANSHDVCRLEAGRPGLPRHIGSQPIADVSTALNRTSSLLRRLPPMEGSVKYKPAWSTEEALDQHQSLMRQHDLQSTIAFQHSQVRQLQAEFSRMHAVSLASELQEQLAATSVAGEQDLEVVKELAARAADAAQKLQIALHMCKLEEAMVRCKTQLMESEIDKSNKEMVLLREAIDDVGQGGGPNIVGLPTPPNLPVAGHSERSFFYCSDCHVGGHGQRYCRYLLRRPNWRVYPSEKWFEDKAGQVSYCPLGRRGVDFTDETYFSRIAMHIKGRLWLEDKRRLYEFVPDCMPKTYVIVDQSWVGDPPPPTPPDAEPWPWFVKETDRNWGTSVTCCMKSEDCVGLTKPNATYVVQKHIENPMLIDGGKKFHIKFYNLFFGLDDGVSWRLYTYKKGYLCVSPKVWSPTDMSKEGQVTIIRSRPISTWELWPKVYPLCRAHMQTVLERAVSQGRLEGRDKKQFEIISSDFVVTEDFTVYLLEFNSGPVLRDPEEASPNTTEGTHTSDAGMVMGALHIVEPWEHGEEDEWDFVIECKGPPPSQTPARTNNAP